MAKNIFLLINIIILSIISNFAVQAENSLESSIDKEPILHITKAWARPSIGQSKNSAAYFEIHNPHDRQITIIGASAVKIANNTELHKSFVDEQGISRMVSIDKIVVPAKSSIHLVPGSIHVMLLDLKTRLKPNDEFTLYLLLENDQKIAINVKI